MIVVNSLIESFGKQHLLLLSLLHLCKFHYPSLTHQSSRKTKIKTKTKSNNP